MRVLRVSSRSESRSNAALFALYSVLAVKRPSGYSFPNLQNVDLTGADFPHICTPLFLSARLTTLSAMMPPEGAQCSLEMLLNDIAAGAPGLTTLTLVASQSSGNRAKGHEPAIGALPARLQLLTVLKLPPYYLTSVVLEMFSKSQLRALEFSQLKDSADNAGDPRDVASTSPKLDFGAFPALQHLSICGTVRDLRNLFAHQHFPAGNLSEVIVRAVRSESERETRDLVSLIVSRCPLLSSIFLLMTPPSNPATGPENENVHWVQDDEAEPILFETIRALSESSSLRSIIIAHARPLGLSDADVLRVCAGLPRLRKLILNPHPRARGAVPPALTLVSLTHVSRYCPNVRSLALYTNASAPIDYPKKVTPLLACRDLQVHLSPLSKPQCVPVLQFLSRILRPGATLRGTIAHMADAWSPERRVNPSLGWGWVLDRLPLLLEARQEERDLIHMAHAKRIGVLSSPAAGRLHY